MMQEAGKQFDELFQIEDEHERVKVAVERFSKGEISAKTIRMFFEKLPSHLKEEFLDGIYAKPVRKDNMRRLPPKILCPDAVLIKNESDITAWSSLKMYYLIHEWETSKRKGQDRFGQMRKLMEEASNPNVPFVFTYYGAFLDRRSPYSNVKSRMQEAVSLGLISDFMGEERLAGDISPLNLPASMTIGCELEMVGIDCDQLKSLVGGRLSRNGALATILDGFRVKSDGSLHENDDPFSSGVEVVSPVLSDSEEDWKRLRAACATLQTLGGRANKTCGGHIHIGVNTLGVDKEAWKTFFDVWTEVEPLLYMISNRRGERTREGGVRYAGLTQLEDIDWEDIHINSEEDLTVFTRLNFGDRYRSLNLTNVGKRDKNTVEFRLPNGTLDYNIIRENILLFGRLVQMCKMHSVNPTWKMAEYEALFEKGLPEKEKLERFLDWVFDDEKEKKIFRERWASRAGEDPLFGEASIVTYKRQDKPEESPKKKMKDQIHEVGKEVPDEERMEAMRALIGQEQQQQPEIEGE